VLAMSISGEPWWAILHRSVWLASPAAILVGAFLVAVPSAQARYRVERVIDGESIRVSGVGTVRLIGVDVPKRIDGLRPWNADTDAAVQFVRALVAAKPVSLEYDTVRTDGAQSPLAYVLLPDGTCLNAEVVRRGLGRVNSEQPFRRLEEFRAYEREARTARRGLWAQATPGELQEPTPGKTNAPPPPPSGLIIVR